MIITYLKELIKEIRYRVALKKPPYYFKTEREGRDALNAWIYSQNNR